MRLLDRVAFPVVRLPLIVRVSVSDHGPFDVPITFEPQISIAGIRTTEDSADNNLAVVAQRTSEPPRGFYDDDTPS